MFFLPFLPRRMSIIGGRLSGVLRVTGNLDCVMISSLQSHLEQDIRYILLSFKFMTIIYLCVVRLCYVVTIRAGGRQKVSGLKIIKN